MGDSECRLISRPMDTVNLLEPLACSNVHSLAVWVEKNLKDENLTCEMSISVCEKLQNKFRKQNHSVIVYMYNENEV